MLRKCSTIHRVHSVCMLSMFCLEFVELHLLGLYRCDFDAEQFAESSIPILVVGTKLDQVVATALDESSLRSFSIAEECGADEINLVIESCSLFSCFFFKTVLHLRNWYTSSCCFAAFLHSSNRSSVAVWRICLCL